MFKHTLTHYFKQKIAPAPSASYLLLLVLAGCASNGSQETIMYRDMFRETHTTSKVILDKLALSERALFEETRYSETIQKFDFIPSEARYYIETLDPPITASLRDSLEIIIAYIEAMAALATGESTKLISARASEIGALATNMLVSFDDVTEPSVFSSIFDDTFQIIIPLKAFTPLVEYAITQRTRREYQSQFLTNYENIDTVLKNMRDLTPLMMNVVKTNIFLSSHSAGGSIADQEALGKLKAFRTLLAGWVVLIEGTRVALRLAKQSLKSSSTSESIEIINTIKELDEVSKNLRMSITYIK
ncbi:hypothetical protein DFO67_12332 [Modicisalibacter xianhensis]|uniref:Uncharacterized protein n=1 Tax=Modicisalibacter xianhensis TaxID=442341 RepID=A0A4R8FIW3_9GAMM|nr:hypothetical protein [Halomonas xianhensis]TDX23828.1 hypothetical protein DFO67_12332 [Halomonas xianhensis]